MKKALFVLVFVGLSIGAHAEEKVGNRAQAPALCSGGAVIDEDGSRQECEQNQNLTCQPTQRCACVLSILDNSTANECVTLRVSAIR